MSSGLWTRDDVHQSPPLLQVQIAKEERERDASKSSTCPEKRLQIPYFQFATDGEQVLIWNMKKMHDGCRLLQEMVVVETTKGFVLGSHLS
jgi:hypothetical protein